MWRFRGEDENVRYADDPYSLSAGIDFKFGGAVPNTLDAQGVIERDREGKAPETAGKLINRVPRHVLSLALTLILAKRCTRSASSMSSTHQL